MTHEDPLDRAEAMLNDKSHPPHSPRSEQAMALALIDIAKSLRRMAYPPTVVATRPFISPEQMDEIIAKHINDD